MKISIHTKHLRAACKRIAGVPSIASNDPMHLTGVAVAAGNDTAVIRSTAIEDEMIVEAPCIGLEPGTAFVPFRSLSEIAKKMPDGMIGLRVKGNTLVATAGALRVSVTAHQASEIPDSKSHKFDPNEHNQFALTEWELRSVLSPTVPCVSDDYSRLYLTGVYIHNEKRDALSAAATDGYVMAMAGSEIQPLREEPEFGFILPERACRHLLRNLADSEEWVDVGVRPDLHLVNFRAESWTYAARTIDAKFPDYKRMIPKDADCGAAIDGAEFAQAVHAMSAFGRGPDQPVAAAFKSGSPMEMVLGNLTDGVEAKHSVKAGLEGCESLLVKFSRRHLKTIALGMKGSGVKLSMKHPSNGSQKQAVLVSPQAPARPSYVLMTLKA